MAVMFLLALLACASRAIVAWASVIVHKIAFSQTSSDGLITHFLEWYLLVTIFPVIFFSFFFFFALLDSVSKSSYCRGMGVRGSSVRLFVCTGFSETPVRIQTKFCGTPPIHYIQTLFFYFFFFKISNFYDFFFR